MRLCRSSRNSRKARAAGHEFEGDITQHRFRRTYAVGGVPFYDPLLLRIYRWGALLSLAGTAFALIGVWRPGPLRWHAPACAAWGLFCSGSQQRRVNNAPWMA